LLDVTVETKQLFGHLDRQIKRLMDAGEEVFDDLLTDDLMKRLLFQATQVNPESNNIREIRQTYNIKPMSAEGDLQEDDDLIACSDEMIEAVTATLRVDIGQIKDTLDQYKQEDVSDTGLLESAACGLHAVANTLGMIGLDDLASSVTEGERSLRAAIEANSSLDESAYVSLANSLVAVEESMVDVSGAGSESAMLGQGIDAVTHEVVACMGTVKESVTGYLQSTDAPDLLADVPGLLNQIAGGLGLAGQERAAAAVNQVRLFVDAELIKTQRELDEKQIDTLADAICSIEFFIEEISENRSNTGTALDVAEQSLYKLGYPSPYVENESVELSATGSEQPEEGVGYVAEPETVTVADDVLHVQDDASVTAPSISTMQIISADADEEILEIFIEEAEEELHKLTAFIPIWVASPEVNDYLADIRRSFHTLKGSGRMVGALAIGEYAWVLENLANSIIDGAVEPHDAAKSVFSNAPGALTQMIGQVKGVCAAPDVDIDGLAELAARCCDPNATFAEANLVDTTAADTGSGEEIMLTGSVEYSVVNDVAEAPDAIESEAVEAVSDTEVMEEFPVLSPDSDAEIVEIFLEEAAEEIVSLSDAIPEWVDKPDNGEALATVRRSMHTLKGSGRMAGAMFIGEFAWSMEDLLNRLIEGAVVESDALRALVSQLPEALSELVEQVRSGVEPAVNADKLMIAAGALARGENVANDVGDSKTETGMEAVVEQADEVSEPVNVEPSLLDIFTTECADHLQAINDYLEEGDQPRLVNETLYRALHTISGISESAEVTSISRLAGELNEVFDGYYHAQQEIGHDALRILNACAGEIASAMENLPDLFFDESLQQSLSEQIAALPRVVVASEESFEEIVAGVAADESEVSGPDDSTEVPVPEELPGKTENAFSSVDQELYEIFIEEASEIIDSSENVLRAWVDDPGNSDHMTEFQRQLHTIKGGARMVDIKAIGDLSHVLESLMTRIADGLTETGDELFMLMQESHDRLSEMLEQVKSGILPEPDRELGIRIERLCGIEHEAEVADQSVENAASEVIASENEDSDSFDEVARNVCEDDGVESHDSRSDESDSEADSYVESGHEAVVPDNEGLTLPKKVERKKKVRTHGEQVRVQSYVLDDMVNYAGEINIYRSRMEQQVSDYRFNLAELDQTITRLRDQLRQLEMETEAQILYRYEQESDVSNQDFDPLEMDRYSNLQQLSRSLIESISDLRSLQELMETTTRESETLLLQQSRVSTDLQEGLMRTRMIPFSGLSSRLRRIVRQSARQLGKKVELQLVGADGEMDRTVIDRVIAPLEHMLRNAVAHGIEVPEQRKASGKQANGTITISFDREGPEIVLKIEDDGAGIDTEAIRKRAIERGLMSENSQLSDNDVMQFILQTGFSTAAEVTQISGRGVGLDVVNSEVKQLGGSLHIESTTGLGTLFTVRLPYTLAINQALLAMAGNESFCVPLGSVEGVVRANFEELATCYRSEDHIYQYAGNDYQLKHLGTLLNTGNVETGDMQVQVPVLLVRVGEKRIALQVEALLGSREIVIKPVGAQLSTIDCISGATILGDGSVVMILDMAAIARMNVPASLPEVPVSTEQESRLVVMVVDDSITVRKVTTRLLERNGYKVMTAKDGVDAMGQLQENVPDMMLLDIEMPRMDGFELATHMRNDERLKHVPVIMITSRTGEKHRERARQIGVNNYLGKPYQENDLLDSIHSIIGVAASGEVA
jgi:chemosensory pili system protein ChpA (sensor histidine kinase/response regulator)